VGKLDKINVSFIFNKDEYMQAVKQYLLAGNIVKKRDLVLLPLVLVIFFIALIYTRFNSWVLLLTLLCLAAVLLLCFLFFFKPWWDFNRKAHLRAEMQLSFTEEGVTWPQKEAQSTFDPEDTFIPRFELAKDESQPTEEQEGSKGKENALMLEDEPESPAGQTNLRQKSILLEPERPVSDDGKKSFLGLRKAKPHFIHWDMFAEAWENREFFFLILQPHKYYIVPKRSFANREEAQYFLKMLYRRVGIVENVPPFSHSR
jgi:hypothetical protein